MEVRLKSIDRSHAIFILAGSSSQYTAARQRLNLTPREAFWLTRPSDLKDLHSPKVYRFGSWQVLRGFTTSRKRWRRLKLKSLTCRDEGEPGSGIIYEAHPARPHRSALIACHSLITLKSGSSTVGPGVFSPRSTDRAQSGSGLPGSFDFQSLSSFSLSACLPSFCNARAVSSALTPYLLRLKLTILFSTVTASLRRFNFSRLTASSQSSSLSSASSGYGLPAPRFSGHRLAAATNRNAGA